MPRKKKDTTPPVAPGFRSPGDRRPMTSDEPRLKKEFKLRRPGPVIPKNSAPLEELPAGDRFVYVPDYSASPGHELYLTFDSKGRQRTHTVYRAPRDPKKA